jgi:hypothetical protein
MNCAQRSVYRTRTSRTGRLLVPQFLFRRSRLLEKTAPGAVQAGRLIGLAMALAGAALIVTGLN